jgi:hypothetical protein
MFVVRIAMVTIKKVVSLLTVLLCFTMFSVGFEQFMLPGLFRHSLMNHYNKKYGANISVPGLGLDNTNAAAFFILEDFWYFFKKSDYYKKDDDVRLMWFIGAEGRYSAPLFYIQENGKKAILIADSLGQRYDLSDVYTSVMCCELNIPIFIIEDRRQNDSSCFLDALIWGKMVTGKLPNGTYRIPQLLEFLFQHSERISLNNSNAQLYYVKKLPTTLLATAQCENFINKYRINGDDAYISSKGSIRSFDSFLSKNNKQFAFDYLHYKGLYISYHFYKYLSFKETVRYGLHTVCSKASANANITYFDVGLLCALSFYCGANYAVIIEEFLKYTRSYFTCIFKLKNLVAHILPTK